jgi:hypothetical protein
MSPFIPFYVEKQGSCFGERNLITGHDPKVTVSGFRNVQISTGLVRK